MSLILTLSNLLYKICLIHWMEVRFNARSLIIPDYFSTIILIRFYFNIVINIFWTFLRRLYPNELDNKVHLGSKTIASPPFLPSPKLRIRGCASQARVFDRRSRVIVSGTANLHYFLRPISLFVHFWMLHSQSRIRPSCVSRDAFVQA